MLLKERLVELSVAATGDEEIFAVGDFLPSHLTLTRFDDTGEALADLDAWGGSRDASDPLRLVVMAVTPTQLYLLSTEPRQGILTADRLNLVETIDRAHLRVRAAERGSSHPLVIEDASAFREFATGNTTAGSHLMRELLAEVATGDDPPSQEH